VSYRPLIATYRLQLRPGFGFDDAAATVPYLAAQGLSHRLRGDFPVAIGDRVPNSGSFPAP
jgi:hypothetical protein